MFCRICNSETKFKTSTTFLKFHLIHEHSIFNIKDYYDKCVKTEDDGKCIGCGKETVFEGLGKGYRKFCGGRCMYDSREIKQKRITTCIEKYGVDNPLKNKEVKYKAKRTLIERYGVDNYLSTEEHKNRMIELYGGLSPFSSKDVRDKSKATIKEKYGTDNVLSSPEVRNKIKETNLKRYGAETPLQSEIVRDKLKDVYRDKFGGDSPFSSKDVRDKSKASMQENHGVDYALSSLEVREKGKRTLIERYGTDNYGSSEEGKAKLKISSIKHAEDLIRNKTLPPGYELLERSKDGVGRHQLKCPEGHEFTLSSSTFIFARKRAGIELCTTCAPFDPNRSFGEREVCDFIKELYTGTVLNNDRKVLNGKFELDIFLPELNLAYDYNGVFWHCEAKQPDPDYHLNKTNACKDQGIRLVHIWEDDWTYKKDIVKSMIKNNLNLTPNRIFARKCTIKEVTFTDSTKFLDSNHIQSSSVSKINLGLYHNDELVSLMTFGSNRINLGQKPQTGEFELLRFCNKLECSVIGGASKLFKYFLDKYKPVKVISYADKGRSQGELYNKLGFKWLRDSKPNYYYLVDGIRENRFKYRKNVLVAHGFDPNKTEHEIMLERGLFRVYDCGTSVFQYSI